MDETIDIEELLKAQKLTPELEAIADSEAKCQAIEEKITNNGENYD
jgi:hypothetical protein